MLQCLLGSGYIFEFSAHSQMRLDLVSCAVLSALGASGVDITMQPTCLASFNTAHKMTPLVPCHSGGQVLEDGCVTDHEGAGQSWEQNKGKVIFHLLTESVKFRITGLFPFGADFRLLSMYCASCRTMHCACPCCLKHLLLMSICTGTKGCYNNPALKDIRRKKSHLLSRTCFIVSEGA